MYILVKYQWHYYMLKKIYYLSMNNNSIINITHLKEIINLIWQLYLVKDQIRIKRDQNIFLNFVALRQILNIPTLASHHFIV